MRIWKSKMALKVKTKGTKRRNPHFPISPFVGYKAVTSKKVNLI